MAANQTSIKPGQRLPGAGRPKGVPNKISGKIRKAFSTHFFKSLKKDPEILDRLQENEPQVYYGIIKELLPKRVELANPEGETFKLQHLALDLAGEKVTTFDEADDD